MVAILKRYTFFSVFQCFYNVPISRTMQTLCDSFIIIGECHQKAMECKTCLFFILI